ncbi:hypothetical protein FHX82_002918 [Amycolatopsis bartoniae]|nr:hypothetical protein [Amycolatopsis bartoniae]MBB2935864.1 hypothetical protein [Amycolatopsis bartoniae]TVT04999.1 hypothetical protein FNH07_23475 [Amycolatopsis bartoniae]
MDLGSCWGWLPDKDAAATHWVPPVREYHPRTGLRSRCGQRCIPSEPTHQWRKLPRCVECRAALRLK